MQASVAVAGDENRYDLRHLSDAALLSGARRLVGTSNQLFADLLAHLAEVDARGVHRTRACSSLYTYCIYELRFSEDAAFRRVSAARLVKAFPVLFDAVASGELHLTGLLLVGPHLTASNCLEVLARAKHRTKKELTRLVRELAPLPNVPARIEPLGPPERFPKALRNPTWEQATAALNPVRELPCGDRPRDWVDAGLLAAANAQAGADTNTDDTVFTAANEPALARGELAVDGGDETEPALARDVSVRLTGPQRYSVQFTATEEYVELVERAKALLSNAAEGSSLAELHLRAMRALVAELEKRKYAGAARTPKAASNDGAARLPDQRRSHSDSGAEAGSDSGGSDEAAPPRQRGRYVPAAIRRSVFVRDEARCSYVDARGERCRETRCLELHHLQPYALGGEHSAENLTLRCHAHNALAAEEDFGRLPIERAGERSRHEPLRHQHDP